MSDKGRGGARVFLAFFLCLLFVCAYIYRIREERGDGMNVRSRESLAMDTIIRVSLHSCKTPEELERILDGTFALIASLDSELSMFKPSSGIALVNASSGQAPVKVSRETSRAVSASLALFRLTGGAFDPTIGPVTALWRIGDAKNPRLRLPDNREIEEALALVGADMATVSPDDRVYLSRAGMKIDLGGIAKGFVSAEAGNFLAAAGVESALIDLGGNVLTVGSRPNGTPWKIGIQHPYRQRGEPICSIEVSGAAVITAGVYERYVEIDGKRYPHIFDPHTGRPVEGDLLSVTVVSEDPTAGDALSTAFMALGLEKSKELLESLPGVEAIFVSKGTGAEPELYATVGIKGLTRIAR
ncbi:MAG: FAD:protein FMN transferase [Synergistaceae bacterium]|jgi:thiamine biosynthesis lipoprotein|nr:FAD:protein FMN transferase [Synergistaceae bacterium]